MAHDRQVESSSAGSAVTKQSRGHSAIVADWLMLYGQTYREEITEEMALLYQEALKDIRPEVLHQSFLRAAKYCKFRPTPAEVRDAAEILMEKNSHGTLQKYPEVSQAERDAAMEETKAQREELRKRLA